MDWLWTLAGVLGLIWLACAVVLFCLLAYGAVLAWLTGRAERSILSMVDDEDEDDDEDGLDPGDEYLLWLEAQWRHPSSRVPRVWPNDTRRADGDSGR